MQVAFLAAYMQDAFRSRLPLDVGPHGSWAANHVCAGGLLFPSHFTNTSATLPDVPQPLPCRQQRSCNKSWTTHFTSAGSLLLQHCQGWK